MYPFVKSNIEDDQEIYHSIRKKPTSLNDDRITLYDNRIN